MNDHLLPDSFGMPVLEAMRQLIGHEPNSLDEFSNDHLDVAGELTLDTGTVAAIAIVYKDGTVSWYVD